MSLARHRGLSTIVTTGILLSAVAVMGTGLVTWSQSNLTERQANLSDSFTTHVNKLKESLVLEHIWFDSSPFVNMTITNIGTNTVNITEIEFRNIDTSQTIQEYVINDGEINPDQFYSFQTSFDYTPYSNFNTVITTERGSVFSTQVTVP